MWPDTKNYTKYSALLDLLIYNAQGSPWPAHEKPSDATQEREKQCQVFSAEYAIVGHAVVTATKPGRP